MAVYLICGPAGAYNGPLIVDIKGGPTQDILYLASSVPLTVMDTQPGPGLARLRLPFHATERELSEPDKTMLGLQFQL